MIYIGIDPGKDGAIVAMNGKGKVLYKTVIPKIKNQVDTQKLNAVFKKYIKKKSRVKIIIEQVHALFGSSAKATFSFGQIFGMLEGFVCAYEFSYIMVAPKTWQKSLYVGINPIRKPSTKNKAGKVTKGRVDTKATSLLIAKRLYPSMDFKRTAQCKGPHDGIVDALLIAEYGRRTL